MSQNRRGSSDSLAAHSGRAFSIDFAAVRLFMVLALVFVHRAMDSQPAIVLKPSAPCLTVSRLPAA